MRKIKVALAGCGNWGLNYLRLLSQLAEVELVCVIDNNPKIEKAIQHKIPANTNFYKDYKSAIKQEEPDAIIISTPLSSHFEICKYALEQRLHVLCEKPVSTSQIDLSYFLFF